VGFVPSLFEDDRSAQAESDDERRDLEEWRRLDLATLDVLRDLGFKLIPIELPDGMPVEPLSLILTAEASTAFDHLTRSGGVDLLERQVRDAWPNVLRQGQLITAVDYIRANRVRTQLIRAMGDALRDVDVYVCPSYGGDNLLLTNLTGQPCVVVPNGFRATDGTPTSITFLAGLFQEEDALAVAHAYQQATDFHLRRPRGFDP
jgi:Asp-tRNA(Asn)/Glu-tRNA(Gln) amidotransferase A subunit family amidase